MASPAPAIRTVRSTEPTTFRYRSDELRDDRGRVAAAEVAVPDLLAEHRPGQVDHAHAEVVDVDLHAHRRRRARRRHQRNRGPAGALRHAPAAVR